MPTTELSIIDPDQSVSSALGKAIAQVVTPDASFSTDINHLAARTRELADTLVARGGFPLAAARLRRAPVQQG